ncbi:hypothetical protein [Ensifer soli]|uniref:hypothetical protein n=1 Tax=Ciceribacter sp. sgz301302 TaxID=3342379 RepID=UPI0035BB7C56
MMRERSIRKTGLVLAACALPYVAVADNGRLTGEDIREAVVGRTVYLAAPLGGEFPLNYRPSGVVDGNGTALGLGKFIQPTDKGKWWIAGDRLCQQFKVWYKGSKMCFTLQSAGPNRVKWVRDNGETGVARISD